MAAAGGRFSYSLSFGMTAVYAYIGLLIWETFSREGKRERSESLERSPASPGPPVDLAWTGRALVAVVALVGWLLLRYPVP